MHQRKMILEIYDIDELSINSIHFDFFLLVYSIDNDTSFERINQFHHSLSSNYGKEFINSKCLVVANKSDLQIRNRKLCTFDKQIEFCKANHLSLISCSSSSSSNVENLFKCCLMIYSQSNKIASTQHFVKDKSNEPEKTEIILEMGISDKINISSIDNPHNKFSELIDSSQDKEDLIINRNCDFFFIKPFSLLFGIIFGFFGNSKKQKNLKKEK